MHRLKLLALSILAVFMLGAVASAVASAEVSLPLFTVETGGTFKSGKTTLFIEGRKLSCEKDKGTTTPINKLLGTFTIDFEECAAGASVGACWSLGDTFSTATKVGTILVGGEYHLVRPVKSEKSALIWLLLSKEDKEEAAAPKLKPIHIECEKVFKLLLLWGNLLCKIEPFHSNTTAYKINCESKEEVQELKEFENNKEEIVKASLKGTVNEGSEREAGLSTAEEFTTAMKTEITYP